MTQAQSPFPTCDQPEARRLAVGDKVEFVKPEGPFAAGAVATITITDNSSLPYHVVRGDDTLWPDLDNIREYREPRTFKVGDRVRVGRTDSRWHRHVDALDRAVGKVGTVSGVDFESACVSVPGNGEWCYAFEWLTLVEDEAAAPGEAPKTPGRRPFNLAEALAGKTAVHGQTGLAVKRIFHAPEATAAHRVFVVFEGGSTATYTEDGRVLGSSARPALFMQSEQVTRYGIIEVFGEYEFNRWRTFATEADATAALMEAAPPPSDLRVVPVTFEI